ncbi:hypothetical protein P7L70_20565 [Tistrella mobilis]|uniref:hypothetical protein n=1 Tax=Tistrella mobilis TaxID=171437 RepID=UPI003555C111
MTEHIPDMETRSGSAVSGDVPMGFPMLPPEVVQFMNAPDVVALATGLQLSTPVVAIALAAKRRLSRKTSRTREQNLDTAPPVAEVVEHPNEIVVRYHGREVRFSHHAADKIFDLFQSLEPDEGAPKSSESEECCR